MDLNRTRSLSWSRRSSTSTCGSRPPPRTPRAARRSVRSRWPAATSPTRTCWSHGSTGSPRPSCSSYGEQGVLGAAQRPHRADAPNIKERLRKRPSAQSRHGARRQHLRDCRSGTTASTAPTAQAVDQHRLAREARPGDADDDGRAARGPDAFKTQDPNGNGEADEIPLTGHRPTVVPFLMNPFIYIPQSSTDGTSPASLALSDGDRSAAAAQDGWREGLRYLARLRGRAHRPGAFSQNQDALLAKRRLAGEPVLGAATSATPGVVRHDRSAGRARQGLRPGAAADRATARRPRRTSSSPGATFVITNNGRR